jgi:hypothetical protein
MALQGETVMSASPGVQDQTGLTPPETDGPRVWRSMFGSLRRVVVNRIDRRLKRLAILITALTGSLALVMAAIMVVARIHSPSAAQRQLLEWQHACQLGLAPEYHLSVSQIMLSSGEAYLYQPPGSGIYTAKYKLEPDVVLDRPIRLADALLALGVPDGIGCLEKKTIPGHSVYWLRLVFAGGQIEAAVMLPGDARRLSPETAVRVFFYYAPDAAYPLDQSTRWRSFAALSTYSVCQSSSSHSAAP